MKPIYKTFCIKEPEPELFFEEPELYQTSPKSTENSWCKLDSKLMGDFKLFSNFYSFFYFCCTHFFP